MDALPQLTAALAGRYTVDREIGRGGMATVYLARDVRHNRRVAVKVLNPELGAVLGVERFLSEIEVTANLQHPNLLPLFDSGEANGLLFYVMPFVEGESLRALIQREKQLPIDQALHIAAAIASALDYAHRHGVIHRDLKPENILMHDREPLVADFGIALAVSNAGGNRITQTGLSLGTPHYMSPEQATGDREIDGRTDIYSLGAVTYEMLVGEPPHDGKTSQAIIAKMLTDRPRSIRLSRPAVPPWVEEAIERSLEKLPADRFHSAHEFAEAVSGKGGPSSASRTATAQPTGRLGATSSGSRIGRVVPWVIAAASLVFAVAAWTARGAAAPEEGVLRYEIPIPSNAIMSMAGANPFAISPNGKFVAYAAAIGDGRRRLFLRASDELQPREVQGSEGAYGPFFSPDGEWIAFFSQGQFLKAPVAGGRTVVVADHTTDRGATWSSSGWLIASNGTRLVRVPAAGGSPEEFTQAASARGETGQLNPIAAPDGESVLYSSLAMGGSANSRIGVASLKDGSITLLDVQGFYPIGIIDGYLVYGTAAGTIMAAPFDLGNRKITGPAVALADQAAINDAVYAVHAQMTSDGSLAYVSGVTRRQIMIVGTDGTARPIGDAGPYYTPRFSPDGKRLAVAMGTLTDRDVWTYELPAGPFVRLTNEGDINDRPEWSPDSRSVFFRSNRDGLNSVWRQPVDGGPATKIVESGSAHIDEGVLSPDGQTMVVQRDSTGNGEIWYRSMTGDTTLRRLGLAAGASGYGARFSADGRWLTFVSTETNVEQAVAARLEDLSKRIQISPAGGSTPLWAPDGKRIFYTNNGRLMAATISSGDPLTFSSRTVVLGLPYTFGGIHADFDVARDGRIVALQSPHQQAQLVVVRNLGAELRARIAGAPR